MKAMIINKFILKIRKIVSVLIICLATNWSIAQTPITAVPSGQKIKMPKIDNTYYGTNNVMQLYIGERTCHWGQWMFDYNGYWESGLYFEQYAVWYNNQIHYAMNGFPIIDPFGTSTNDEDKKCVTKTDDIEIERSVYIPPGDAKFFKISYVLKNTGTETLTDVRFFEVVDFDILGYTSNFGWYDSNTDFVWIKSDDTFKNGFSGSKQSTRHCAIYWNHAIFSDASDGNLTNDNEYSGDAGIGLQWNIGDLAPGATWDITITFWFGQPNHLTANAGDDQIVFAGQEVSFDATNSTAEKSEIVAYNWDMDGDGEYDDAHGATPTYTFEQHGNQDVLLQIIDDQGVEAYDICTITILPSFAGIVVKDYLPVNGITLNVDSISPPPHSVTTVDDKQLIEWHIDGMVIDSSLDLSYDLEILDPVAGESRMVESSTDLSYTDKSNTFQHFVLGPSFIDVTSEHSISVKTDKEKYFANEKAKVSVDLSFGSNTIKTFTSENDWESGIIDGLTTKEILGKLSIPIPSVIPNIIVNGGFETGNIDNWTAVNHWVSEYETISGTYSLELYGSSYYDAYNGEVYSSSNPAYAYQEIALSANVTEATLSWSDKSWMNNGEYKVEIRDSLDNILKTLYSTDRSYWDTESRSVDIKEFAGQTVRVYFLVGALTGITQGSGDYEYEFADGDIFIDDLNLDVVVDDSVLSGNATYIIDAGQTVIWDKLSFESEIPEGTSLSFKFREANTINALESTSWSSSINQNNANVPVQVSRFLEVQVNMLTGDYAFTPSLDMLKIFYVKLSEDALNFKTYIKDSKGKIVEELSSTIPSIELGKSQRYEYIFNTKNNFAGNYFAHVDLYENNTIIASGIDGFEIVSQSSEIAVNSNVKTNKSEYIKGETAAIKSTVFNSNSNVNINDLTVTVEVNDVSNDIIETYNYAIANLLQQSTDQKDLQFVIGASLPGNYTVKQTVTSGTEILSSKQAVFIIVTGVEQGKGIAGNIHIDPLTVKRGSGTASVNINAKNTGNVDLSSVELKVDIYNPASLEIEKSFTTSTDLGKDGILYTQVFSYANISLMPGSYPVTLTANLVYSGQNISIPLDVNGMTVTNDAPVAHAGADQTIEGISSTGATASLNGSGSTDANSTNPPAMNNDIVSYEWKENNALLSNEMTFSKILSWGVHTIILTAKDSLGLTSTDTIVINIADTVAPVIAELTPGNEIIVATAFPTFTAKVSDTCSGVNYTSAQLTVDNNPLVLTSNSTTGIVSATQENSLADGWHDVILKVSDNANNQATSALWKVGVDTTAPVISDMSPINNSITNDNTSHISVKVADVFSGIKVDSIVLNIDGQNLTAVYNADTGLVTATASTLTDGWHNVVLTVSDKVGNQSSSAEWKIGIDATGPAITDYSPVSNAIGNDNTPSISVKVADIFSGIKVDSIALSIDGQNLTAAYNVATGLVTATASTLTDGWHNVVLEVSDKVGNQSTSAEWKIGIDATGPAITDYSPVSNAISNDNTPSISVKVADVFSGIKVDSINLSIDGNAVTAEYDATTGLITTTASNLTDGWHNVILEVSDKVGNQSTSAEWKIGIDSTGPAITDYSPINNSIISDNTPAVSVKVVDLFSGIKVDTVTMTIDGNEVEANYNASTGMVTADLDTALADGWHDVILTLSDNAGNQSSSATWKVGIDTTIPLVSDMSPVNNAVISDSTPSISMKVADTFSGIKVDSINLSIDGNAVTAEYDATTGLITTTALNLTDGWHNVVLAVSDKVGNQNIISDWKFGVDITAPDISDYSHENNSIISNSTPDISVKIADTFSGINSETITMTIDENEIEANYNATTGIVTATPVTALADGWHDVILKVSDNQGNEATSAEWEIGVDTTKPNTTGLAPENNVIVENATPELSVNISDAFSGIKADSIIITVDDVALSVAYDADTGKVTATPATALSDGWHNVVLKVSDKVGNQTIVSDWKVGIDTVAPVISDYSPATNSITGDATPALSVKVSDAFSGIDHETIDVAIDGNAVSAAYDSATGIVSISTLVDLTDGWHNVVLKVSDKVGNQSTSIEWKIGVDTTKPTINDMTPESGSVLYGRQPEISAVVADSFSGIAPDTIQLSFNGSIVQHAYDAETGKVTAVITEDLENGEYTISLKASDKVGNENTSATWELTILNYLVFHNSTEGELDISGSNKLIQGRIHSNADLNIVGTNTDVMDVASAVGEIKVNGSKHDIPQQQAGAPSQPMPVYDIDYYRQNADFTHSGDLSIGNGDILQPGIHFVNGNVLINTDVDVVATIVATGHIKLASSEIKLVSADSNSHVVLYSATYIDLSCNNAYLKGIIYAPNGECKLASNGNTMIGAIIADTVDISGSVLNISPWTN